MRTIFVFIKCELGRAYEVADYIVDNLDPIPSLYSISGAFDLIAQYHVSNDLDIGRFVNGTIHAVPGIRDTQTTVAFNAFSKDSGFTFDADDAAGAPPRG